MGTASQKPKFRAYIRHVWYPSHGEDLPLFTPFRANYPEGDKSDNAAEDWSTKPPHVYNVEKKEEKDNTTQH